MTSQIIDAALCWQAVAAIADRAQLSLSQAALARIAHANARVRVSVERCLRCYGVNTGVGAAADVLVAESRQSALSHNVIMSHVCEIGAALSVPETRAINNFAHGRSGVRARVVESLVDQIPHANIGALRALDIIENFDTILTTELLAATQAYEFQNPALRRAAATDGVPPSLRISVPAYADDRAFAVDIAATSRFIRQAAPP
jgi:histidine ammonia-lyase